MRRLAAEWGIAHPYYSDIPDLIEAYARADAPDQARALLPEFLAQVPGRANPQSAARAARCRGIIADDFNAHFLEAIGLHEHSDVVFQHARTLLCYGERLRRARPHFPSRYSGAATQWPRTTPAYRTHSGTPAPQERGHANSATIRPARRLTVEVSVSL